MSRIHQSATLKASGKGMSCGKMNGCVGVLLRIFVQLREQVVSTHDSPHGKGYHWCTVVEELTRYI